MCDYIFEKKHNLHDTIVFIQKRIIQKYKKIQTIRLEKLLPE